MKSVYTYEGNNKLDGIKTNYADSKQMTAVKDGITYTRKGKSYARLSPLDRVLRSLGTAVLTITIVPLISGSIRNTVKNFAKEVWTGKEKTNYYTCPVKDTRECKIFISTMTSQMRNNIASIDAAQSACCFVKVTEGEQSFIKQYIFKNTDNSQIDKVSITKQIDKIGENLTKSIHSPENIKQEWLINSKLPDGRWFTAHGNAAQTPSKKSKGKFEQSSNAGEGRSWGLDALKDCASGLKSMGVANNGYIYSQADNNYISGPHFENHL